MIFGQLLFATGSTRTKPRKRTRWGGMMSSQNTQPPHSRKMKNNNYYRSRVGKNASAQGELDQSPEEVPWTFFLILLSHPAYLFLSLIIRRGKKIQLEEGANHQREAVLISRAMEVSRQQPSTLDEMPEVTAGQAAPRAPPEDKWGSVRAQGSHRPGGKG